MAETLILLQTPPEGALGKGFRLSRQTLTAKLSQLFRRFLHPPEFTYLKGSPNKGSRRAGFQKTSPLRGRKPYYARTPTVVEVNMFQKTSPLRGRKPEQARSDCLYGNVSKNFPFTGTETSWQGWQAWQSQWVSKNFPFTGTETLTCNSICGKSGDSVSKNFPFTGTETLMAGSLSLGCPQ